MPGLERFADFAQLLEAPNPRSLPGARIYDEDGVFAVVDLGAIRRNDVQQRVADRMRQLVAAHHQLASVDQDRSRPVRQHLLALVAALRTYSLKAVGASLPIWSGNSSTILGGVTRGGVRTWSGIMAVTAWATVSCF